MKPIVKLSMVMVVLFSMIISGHPGVEGIAPQHAIAQDRACHTVDLPAVADTYLNTNNPNNIYGSNTTLTADARAWFLIWYDNDTSALMQWNLDSIPDGSTINSTTLRLYVTDGTGDSFPVYQVGRQWSESQATWNNRLTGTGWGTAGAQDTDPAGGFDRSTTSLGIITGTTGWRDFPLNASATSLVSGWVNGTTANYGLIIQNYADSADDEVTWRSREYAGYAPVLRVEYCIDEVNIGDFIWDDTLDPDGVYDAGEAGLGGVVVELWWRGLDGVWGTGDDVMQASTTTNASGLYNFYPIYRAGEYRAVIAASNFLVDGALYGFSQTYPIATTYQTITYPAGISNNYTADFGLKFNTPTADDTVSGPEVMVTDEHVQVSWQTVNEVDILGFRLYRDGQSENELIHMRSAEYAGSPVGYSYLYADLAVDPLGTHTYWLEVVTRDGSYFLQPRLVNPFRIFMPTVRQ